MTQWSLTISKSPLGWIALYKGRDGTTKIATDARGDVIRCETAELAASVAAMRQLRTLPSFS